MNDNLFTVRDYLRFAVSSFRRANLVFGHGTAEAVDEAAFLILEGLGLPIDDINPWLDARLTPSEREHIGNLIEARTDSRKPAAYLLNRAYLGPFAFYVDERVIVPRSFIAEMLLSGNLPFGDMGMAPRILDLCSGSGCLAIVAAHLFPDAEVHAVELSADAALVARRNIADHGLDGRITLHEGDLFAPLTGERFDLIIANPPYVADAEIEALSPEYRAEPLIALAGGHDGLDIVRRILDAAPAHLSARGGLLCEIGTGADTLQDCRPDLAFQWLDTEESESEVFWLEISDLGGRP